MSKYDESSIRVLKGLEPVRTRPGMYTRTDSPMHILQEVIDNSCDEALGGYAKRVSTTLFRDGSVSVEDDGRGIPVGMHPEEQLPVVQIAFTQLHAGGKFDKTTGEGAYAFSGGLHGVGVAVTTALSKRVDVEVRRDRKVHRVSFEDGGRLIGTIVEGEGCGAKTGTKVRVWPDGSYFESPVVSAVEMERLLRSKAALLKGVTVVLSVEKASGEFEEKRWSYENGLASYLEELNRDSELVAVFSGSKKAGKSEAFAEGEGAEWVLAWYEDGGKSESFVNLIPTPLGGTHESGLKAGAFEAIKAFVEHHAMLPRGVRLQQEDVAAKLGFVLSASVLDPQFQGQVKEKLSSRDAVKLVSTMLKDPLELWLNQNVERGKAIAELAIKHAAARLRAAQKVERRKSSNVAVLPGKLTDCESTDLSNNEVFLVEGDSAGGSAKMARNKETQAVLPLRGKVQNSWEVEADTLFANNEIHDIAVALGVDPHESVGKADLSGLRYGKVVILSDADVDGAHIQCLLCTLFYKHFPGLVARGHVWIARPPLYRVDVRPSGKVKQPRRIYALDEHELAVVKERLISEGVKTEAVEVGRFKGLGEMNPEQLSETAMDPATRSVLQVREDTSTEESIAMFTLLMSKGEPAARRQWMAERGNKAEVDA